MAKPLPFLMTRLFSNRLIIYDLLNSSLSSTNIGGGLLGFGRVYGSLPEGIGSSYITVNIL